MEHKDLTPNAVFHAAATSYADTPALAPVTEVQEHLVRPARKCASNVVRTLSVIINVRVPAAHVLRGAPGSVSMLTPVPFRVAPHVKDCRAIACVQRN